MAGVTGWCERRACVSCPLLFLAVHPKQIRCPSCQITHLREAALARAHKRRDALGYIPRRGRPPGPGTVDLPDAEIEARFQAAKRAVRQEGRFSVECEGLGRYVPGQGVRLGRG